MALTYTQAIAALLNNGSKQVLPISMSNLIELSDGKSNFGTNAQSVQDALGYLAGAFAHANTVAQTAQDNAYAYVGKEISNLDVAAVGSTTDAGHDKFISYIYQENGYIHAFAQDMSAANVAYSGSDGRATVAAELQHINETIAQNLEDTTLSLVSVTGTGNEEQEVAATTVAADGSVYRLKQGNKTVATFNIEKDSFVKTGAVVRGTLSGSTFTPGTEQAPGEYYIKLEIRTQDDAGTGTVEHTLYIPAESLVDAYTANNNGTVQPSEAGSNNVNVHVDTTANTISAVIKAGGVGTNELADSAVTTVKIADSAVTTAKILDENVTLAKLASDVKTSLGKADSALQQKDIVKGTAFGTISFKGTDVNVNLDNLKTIATSGNASDVAVSQNADLDSIAGYTGNTHVNNVQDALEKLAVKVKQINDGSVTSVTTNVVDNGNDTQNAVSISMTPTTATNGAVTVQLTHNLGAAAALGYQNKDTAHAVTDGFWDSIQ